ncbi:MAG: GAF domain-containing protein [Anaerolineae bacterium]|jgi:GAF domain-containing protein|nr:GAF domain-containing protein [Anaerolineae bacterium]
MGIRAATSSNPIVDLRQRFLTILLTLSLFGGLLEIAILYAFAQTANNATLIALILQVTISALGLLIQRRSYTIAANLIMAILLFNLIVSEQGYIQFLSAALLLSLAAAFSPRLFGISPRLIYFALNMIIFARLLTNLLLIETLGGLFLLTGSIGALLIVSIATRFFVTTAERITETSVQTSNLLQATAEIGQVISNVLDLDQLFERAVNLIRERFGFYHVQIFLVDDERKWARLVASTGEIGQRLLIRGHKLEVGSKSVIGRVTQLGQVIVVRDTDQNVIHMANELLSNTRAEMALPIVDGERIIGALDVQSTRPNVFTAIETQALQVMSNLLGSAIRNARSFRQQAINVEDNKRLLLEAQINLREIQRLNRQLTRQAWDKYLDTKETIVGVRLENNRLSTEVQWSDGMRQAVDDLRPITHRQGEQKTTAVPIILRGEVLGAIEVTTEALRENDLVEMVQSVAQNLAVSLDNVRLFEEVQQSATQEQYVSSIVERYQSAQTVDDLLKITMSELLATLGAEQGTIRLGNVETNGQPSHE